MFMFCTNANANAIMVEGWKWPKRCQTMRWNALLFNQDMTLVSISLPLGHGQAMEVKPCVGEAVSR